MLLLWALFQLSRKCLSPRGGVANSSLIQFSLFLRAAIFFQSPFSGTRYRALSGCGWLCDVCVMMYDSEAEQASLDQLFGYTGILSEAAPHIISFHMHTGPAKNVMQTYLTVDCANVSRERRKRLLLPCGFCYFFLFLCICASFLSVFICVSVFLGLYVRLLFVLFWRLVALGVFTSFLCSFLLSLYCLGVYSLSLWQVINYNSLKYLSTLISHGINIHDLPSSFKTRSILFFQTPFLYLNDR